MPRIDALPSVQAVFGITESPPPQSTRRLHAVVCRAQYRVLPDARTALASRLESAAPPSANSAKPARHHLSIPVSDASIYYELR